MESHERINDYRREPMRLMPQAPFAQSERRFQDFIEGSKDMIYIADSGAAIVLVNKAGEYLLASSKSDILGQPLVSFRTNASNSDYFNDLISAEGYVTISRSPCKIKTARLSSSLKQPRS